MMPPPLWMRLRIIESGRTKLRLWLPFVLIWLVFLLLIIILSPLVLLASLIMWGYGLGKKLLMVGPMFFYVLCALHGLNIQVDSVDSQFSISFQ